MQKKKGPLQLLKQLRMQNQNATTNFNLITLFDCLALLLEIETVSIDRPTKTQSTYLSRGSSIRKRITQMTKLSTYNSKRTNKKG